ncbi:MAG: nitroreductase family protein [Bacillota bacterium]|nr:nitroreductase family protein [Bacillota bacterium]
MNDYEMIFKRKSFHVFRNIEQINDQELEELQSFIQNIQPLDESIPYSIKIVSEGKRGSQYCIEFYSEEKGNYLRNIGYIGEQIDLWLAKKNIGSLWFGIGRPEEKQEGNQQFVIMMAIAKMPENSFRKDMFKAKRKSLEEIWQGEQLPLSNIIRFAPSACNTQPWKVEHREGILNIYRYKKPGKRGIMPLDKVTYYNRIDIGIFLYFLETCLIHDGYVFESVQYFEDEEDVEQVLVVQYKISKEKGGRIYE